MAGSVIPQEAFIGAVPALREDLRLHEAAPLDDGSPCWTIQDPVTNQFYLIGWLEFEFLSRWRLGKKGDILAKTNEETPLEASAEELDALLDFLVNSKLVVHRGVEATAKLLQETEKKRLPFWKKLLHNYLFFRVPIFHPDRFLKAAYPWIRWIYSSSSLVAIGVIGLLAFYLTVQQFDLFASTFVDTLSFDGIAGYIVALAVTKSLHELGHALTATHYGARVAHMGVAFVVMWPMLYTDTGETWRLKRSRHRLGIASAGVATELSVAVIALLLWNLMPDGTVKNGLFFLATTAWVISLAINVSPFLRFDGYYILSDILNIPNLHQRSGDAAKTWLRKNLLGWPVEYSESVSPRRRRFYIAFATAAWLYRMVVFIGIAVAVYYFFFKALGIFLGLVELWWFVFKPIYREATAWREGWSATTTRAKLGLSTIALGLVILLLLPWKGSISAPALYKAENSSALYAQSAGRVESLPIDGQVLRAGERVFELSDVDLLWKLELSADRKRAIEDELKGLLGLVGGEAQRASLLEQWKRLDAEEQETRSKIESLHVVAPYDGVLRDLDSALSPGVWVNEKKPLAMLVSNDSVSVDAFVRQEDLSIIEVGAEVLFYSVQEPETGFAGVVEKIDYKRAAKLPNIALSTRFGGEILVENDQDGVTPVDTLFRVKIALSSPSDTDAVRVGTVVINTKSQSLSERFLNAITSVLIREVSF